MLLTSRLLLVMLCCLSHSPKTSSRPASKPCTNVKTIDLLALALTRTSSLPSGVEITKQNGIYGYRFFPEAKLIGMSASEVMVNCDYFPQEFSLVFSLRREMPRNEKEFLLTLIGPDRQTILFGVSLQHEALHLDFVLPSNEQRHAVSFRVDGLADGKWHTIVLVVTRKKVKFNLDCRNTIEKILSDPFPRKLNTKKSKFHIASRRRLRNRFTGLLREIRLVPGTDASISRCSGNPIWTDSESEIESSRNSFVYFQEEDDEALTCTTENKGLLKYRTEKGDLEMCEGIKWMRLATTNERLDYVMDFGQLQTKSKTHDVEIFRISDEGLFLASANQGRDRDMDSTIYKWNEILERFTSFQNISTDIARDWEYFSIENEHFLAVANQGSDENMIAAQSVIYRWDEMRQRFVVLQYIKSFAARNWESFTIDGKHYLALANYASPTDHHQKSWIYIWEPDHRAFAKYQIIDTTGGYDMEYFEINGNHFLAVANSYDGVTTQQNSVVYQWILSNFVPLVYFETFGATDWEHFEISGKHYLAVANYYDNSQEHHTYLVDSYIFEYLPDINRFQKIQNLPTHGALDIEFFVVGKDSYLIASTTDDDDAEDLTSVIYRWQGIEHFVPVHNFSTSPCSDWESFRANSGKHFLVSANVQTRNSMILQLVTY